MRTTYRAIVRRQTAIVWLLVAVLSCAAGRLAAAELSAEKKQAVDAAIEKFMAAKKVPGLSAAIATGGAIAYEKGYGKADLENDVPATPETVYRLASISKMLTAVAALQLAEEGSLDLDAPIQEYVPGFPEKQAPLSCRHLLAHQGGIRHYKGNEVQSTKAYPTVRASFGVFQDDPLLFAPGEKFSYTTYGYNVLGAAVEGASGENYVDYVMEHICEPAGMTTIRPDIADQIIPHRAAGYRKRGPRIVNDLRVDVTNKVPGGGWCSTPGDLARFAIALVDGKLLEAETLEKMWTPQKTTAGVQTEAGYGCFVHTIDDDRLISHSGGQPKVSTFLVFSPKKKTAVALMCNLRNTPLRELARELMKVVGSD